MSCVQRLVAIGHGLEVDALLAVARAEVSILLVENETGVAPAKGNSGKEDDDTLEDDEGDLVLDQVTIVAVLKLGDTVDASSEDEDDGGAETGEEGAQAPAESGGLLGADVSDHVVGEGNDEEDEDDDLENETNHGDGDAEVRVVVAGGEGTAGGLEDEADNVKGDEDPDEELGLEARELRAEEHDGCGECYVDGGGIEDGSDGQTD